MRTIETNSKTRKEAIQKALDELDVELHEVDIEILDEGSKGIFGFGARDVKVRVTTEVAGKPPRRDRQRSSRSERPQRKERGERQQRSDRSSRSDKSDRPPRSDRSDRSDRPQRSDRSDRPPRSDRSDSPQRERRPEKRDDDPARSKQAPRRQERERPKLEPVSESYCKEAAALLGEIIDKMGFEANIESKHSEDGGAYLSVTSPDSAILIGRKGRSLSALQYLLNRMMRASDSTETVERIVVDIEGYLERRRTSLEEMALHLGEKAKTTGRNMRVKPLDPQERRIIHVTLQHDEELRTFSVGESLYRTVIIAPKNQKHDSRGGDRRPRRGGRRRYSNQDRDRDSDRDSGSDRDRDSGSDRDRDSGSDRDRDRGSDQDRDRGSDQDRDRGSDRDRDRGSDRDRDRGSDRDRDRGSDRDRDRGRDRDQSRDRSDNKDDSTDKVVNDA